MDPDHTPGTVTKVHGLGDDSPDLRTVRPDDSLSDSYELIAAWFGDQALVIRGGGYFKAAPKLVDLVTPTARLFKG